MRWTMIMGIFMYVCVYHAAAFVFRNGIVVCMSASMNVHVVDESLLWQADVEMARTGAVTSRIFREAGSLSS